MTVPDPNAFSAWLEAYPHDLLDQELSEAMAQCVDATMRHQAKSTLTLKVTMDLAKGIGVTLDVTAEVTAKPAKAAAPVVTFFPTADNGLTRDDPGRVGVTQPIPFRKPTPKETPTDD